MFSDSHCHLHYIKNTANDDLLAAMKDAKVHRALVVMCALSEYDTLKTWTQKSDAALCLGMSIGLHPCQDLRDLTDIASQDLLALDGEDVWAFGETGLDYYWDKDKKQAQQHSFVAHIHAGKVAKKPIIIHTRDAAKDTLAVLKSEDCHHGIIHCFTEDYAFAKAALDLGLYISFSGIISFKKSTALQDTAKKLPLDRLLIETDSPYLAPVPKRGKENQPAFVPFVAAALGELFGKSTADIGKMTDDNFTRLLAGN